MGTGGAERAVAIAADELIKRGRDIRVLCLERAPAESAVRLDAPVHYLSGMTTECAGTAKLAALPVLAARLASYVRREGVSAVMSHLFRANFVNVLAGTLFRSRHRSILVNHTRVSRLASEGIQGRISMILCTRLYPRANIVASVSLGAAMECARILALPVEKSITLYDPIGTSAAEGSAASAAPAAKPAHAIVSVGRLVRLKRFCDIIEAFNRIAFEYPDLELRIVGDGPERSTLGRLASASEASRRIHFLGRLSNPQPAVAGCAVYVSASETEGFGMAIVEALAAGVPVVASDCAYGPREILAPSTDPSRLLNGHAGIEMAPYGILYPVGSVEALTIALRRILRDAVLRADLAKRGLIRAADFSVERSTAAYEKLLFAE
jgi:N-acetylgalactosamine-N,N'-diacetylbacillosaminyl-diphospho-undecaprenol 4-alpha-N-acetylgalactosaminyltransferase